MEKLNLPEYKFRFRENEGKKYIFDAQRKKYIVLTPEEWVRQNFVRYLIEDRGFPAGKIAIEKSLKYNNMSRRCDILAYGEGNYPVVLVECKSPVVKITSEVFDQAAVYNMSLRVRYLIVTNGISHYCAEISFTRKEVNFLKEIPGFNGIAGNQ